MDEAAFEAFYRKTAGGIWSYIYRMTGDAAMADDLLQKTFFSFLRSNPRSPTKITCAAMSTRPRRIWSSITSARRSGIATRAYEWMPAEVRPDRGDLRHDMARVFADLKPQERALLWLAHVEGNSHEEIAEAIGVKSKSMKVHALPRPQAPRRDADEERTGPGGDAMTTECAFEANVIDAVDDRLVDRIAARARRVVR